MPEEQRVVTLLSDYMHGGNAFQRELIRRWVDSGPAAERPDRNKIAGGLFTVYNRPHLHVGVRYAEHIRMSATKCERLCRDLARQVLSFPTEDQVAIAAEWVSNAK